MIRIIVETSCYSGHYEPYPKWIIDERYPSGKEQQSNQKRAKEVLAVLTEILKEHGITQSCHFEKTYEN